MTTPQPQSSRLPLGGNKHCERCGLGEGEHRACEEPDCGPLVETSRERHCSTCIHVVERYDQLSRCARFRSGKHKLYTWTARHDSRKCGSDLQAWEPKKAINVGASR